MVAFIILLWELREVRGLYSDGDILYNIILNILYQPTNSSLSSDFLTESHPVSARAGEAR